MFSSHDVEQIFHSLPPDAPKYGTRDGIGPPLFMSTRGRTLITLEHTFREFENLVNAADLPVLATSVISNALEIDPEAVLQFARASPELALISRDGDIVPSGERAKLISKLESQLTASLVSKAEFARQNNLSLESVDDLIISVQESDKLGGALAAISHGYLASKAYRIEVSTAIQQYLDKSVAESKPAELSPQFLPGAPPLWYIDQLLVVLLAEGEKAADFHITLSEADDVITCVLKESMLKKRSAMIAAVQAGEQPYLDLHTLVREFPDTYPSLHEAKKQVQANSEILVHGFTAISMLWLTRFGSERVDELRLLGYTALQPKILETFPADCETFLTERMEQHVHDAFAAEAEDNDLEKVGYHLVRPSKLASDRALLLSAAKENASLQWKIFTTNNPPKDLKLQIDDIFSPILTSQPIIQDLLKDKPTRRTIEDAFWDEIARLENENEQQFADFWAKRIICRIKNWEIGLQSLGEGKLQDALAEVLFEHLKTENLPVSIAKASDQHLLHSRKTRRNISKLQSSLSTSTSLSSLLTALDKFNKKQSIPELDAGALAAAKEVMLSDMSRWMQKRNDGPTLFLTLIAFLLAESVEGVVYATGKFSPKLLKVIKPAVSAEEYERLEGWKGMIKKDVLGEGEKKKMKRWVREFGEGTVVETETKGDGEMEDIERKSADGETAGVT